MKQNRREFLKKSTCALGMAALATQVEHFGLMSALAQKADDETSKNPFKKTILPPITPSNPATA